MPLSSTIYPPDFIRYSPRNLIYDPGKCIADPVKQLHPFASIVEIYREEKDLKLVLENAHGVELILLLIFPDKDSFETKAFLDEHIRGLNHLHSLYLIFSNGVQFHKEWIDRESALNLRWCRSYTRETVTDILHFCRTACCVAIDFYQQQMRVVQDAVDRGDSGVSASLVELYATEGRRFTLIQKEYFSQFK